MDFYSKKKEGKKKSMATKLHRFYQFDSRKQYKMMHLFPKYSNKELPLSLYSTHFHTVCISASWALLSLYTLNLFYKNSYPSICLSVCLSVCLYWVYILTFNIISLPVVMGVNRCSASLRWKWVIFLLKGGRRWLTGSLTVSCRSALRSSGGGCPQSGSQ